MNLDLDNLLELDCLTPHQERAIRRLLDYRIEKHNSDPLGFMIFRYSEKTKNPNSTKGLYFLDLKDLKATGYKDTMCQLIIDNYKKSDLAQMKKILIRDPVVIKKDLSKELRLNQKGLMFPQSSQVTAQSLYRILQLILNKTV